MLSPMALFTWAVTLHTINPHPYRQLHPLRTMIRRTPRTRVTERRKRRGRTGATGCTVPKRHKAFATRNIGVNPPELAVKDLSDFTESLGPFLRMSGQTHATGRVKCDLLSQCCKTKYLEKQVQQIVTTLAMFTNVFVAHKRQYPSYETDLSIRTEIQNLAMLPNNPKAAGISELLANLGHWVGRLTPGSYGSDKMFFWAVAKIPRDVWDECRTTAERKARTVTYEDLCVLLLELALEKESDQHLNAYRPGAGDIGNHDPWVSGTSTWTRDDP